MVADPILQGHELESAAWKKLKAHLEAELAERRTYNDGETLTERETAIVRGDIKRLKKLLKIGEYKAPG